LNTEMKALTNIAKLAGRELTGRFRKSLKSSLKNDRSLVTEADLASQAVIVKELGFHFPGDRVLSEEEPSLATTLSDITDKALWIVDPLDGTTNFANGFDYFCVSIARAEFSAGFWQPTLGAVYLPTSDVMYTAERGGGAFRNGVSLPKLQTRPRRDFEQCFLATGFAYDRGEELERDIRLFSKIAAQCQSIRRPGAAALDLCLVAEGVFDAFWERNLKIWDVAGASLLLEEVGASQKCYDGRPFQLSKDDLVAGRPEVVDTLLNLF
jgi:myo-inositol-1(or 4)-monophosphatase